MAAPAASDIPMQIAQTIQDAHLNRAPSAAHDINPSTAADTREPVRLVVEDGDSDDDDDIPVSVLRPQPRGGRHFSHLPPIPDLRFEQSYLHSIKDAKSWWMVAWITTRDQVRLCLCLPGEGRNARVVRTRLTASINNNYSS